MCYLVEPRMLERAGSIRIRQRDRYRGRSVDRGGWNDFSRGPRVGSIAGRVSRRSRLLGSLLDGDGRRCACPGRQGKRTLSGSSPYRWRAQRPICIRADTFPYRTWRQPGHLRAAPASGCVPARGPASVYSAAWTRRGLKISSPWSRGYARLAGARGIVSSHSRPCVP